MELLLPTLHEGHAPTKDYSDGFPPFDFMEVPARLQRIAEGLLEGGAGPIVSVQEPIERAFLADIHDGGYLDFLAAVCDDLAPGEEYIPSIFRRDLSCAPLRFRGGMYCKEIGTPLTAGTYLAALNSAQAALVGARRLLDDAQDRFALCRPPGHHAHKALYGGYSFINNAAVAFKALKDGGLKAAILDIDYHIGDGTASLADRLGFDYYSLHIDPWRNYPYFDADIRFSSRCRLIHLPHKTAATAYLEALKDLVAQIDAGGYDALILSIGFDILASDYCQDEFILIENRHLADIAALIRGGVSMPVLLLLEGGYDMPNLQEAARYFMQGWRG